MLRRIRAALGSLWPAIAVIVLTAASCRRTRTVKLAWDAPASQPVGYKILIDNQLVMNVPPPPVDPSCRCLSVTVAVPAGSHTISVIAFNQFGDSPPAAVAYVK